MMTKRLLAAIVLLCGPLLAQESAQLIGAPEVIGTDVDSFRVAPDLNGDGDKDAVSVWFGGPFPSGMRVAGWWNDGAGVLTPGWSLTLPISFNPPPGIGTIIQAHFGAGDLNGDGLEDFVFALDKQVGWWLSHGDTILPDVPWVVAMPNQVVDVAVADFDQDGLADVAILTQSELRIYRSQASAAPILSSTQVLANDGIKLVTGHFDPGPTPDLAVFRWAGVNVYPVVAGVIQPGLFFSMFLGGNDSSIAGGDVDNDGDDDLVVSSSILGTMTSGPQFIVIVLRRTGPATFTPEAWQVFSPPAIQTTVGLRALVDVDADGDLDLLGLAGTQGILGIFPPSQNYFSQPAVLRRNDGTGAFGTAETWSVHGGTTDFAVTDLDADGDLDMLAGRCVHFGVFPYGFAPIRMPRIPNGIEPLADVDRDGDPDLTPGIAGAMPSGSVVAGTAVNDGAGGFTSANSVPPPPPTGTFWAGPGFPGDFDGDGDLDLLVEHLATASQFSGFEMRLLKNLGGGAFADGGSASVNGATMRNVPIPTAAGSMLIPLIDRRAALVADVDGDGDVDVVPMNPAYGDPYSPETGSKVWLNGGGGFFTASTGLAGFRPAAAGDVNGDAIPDLVGTLLVSNVSVQLVVVPGLGAGAFGAPVTIVSTNSVSYSLSLPALSDADGDGDLDVAMVWSSTLTVFQNDGFGNFSANVLGTFLSPLQGVVRVGDLNGDGLADLAASTTADALWTGVWLRNPAGPGFLPTRMWSASLRALSDVDGDGDLDALAAAGIFRNRSATPPANAVRKQYGSGLAGSGGLVPILGSAGVLRVGSSGAIRITNALGGASALFGAGTTQTSQPLLGGTLLMLPDVVLSFTLTGAPGVSGAGYLDVPWTIPPGLAGFQAFEQAAIQDPGAAQGWSLTQGLQVIIGS